MNDFVYVVTAVDYGDSCDGKARVLGVFRDEAAAKAYVKNDMEDMCERLVSGYIVDFDEMSITNEDDDTICLWSVEGMEVK